MQAFYSQYAPYLKGVCSRYVSDREDAKDVFQSALVRIITHITEFRYHGQGSLQAWAARIVVNEAISYLRDTKRHEMTSWDDDTMEVPEEDDPPIRDIPPEVIHQMVKQLPTGYRTVFNLYVIEDKSHEEIASLLGISPGTSSSQLHRARHLLADMIKRYNDKNEPPR
jgi:RNA polymerase sigma-70 factor (ECF subfamily)